MPDYNPPATHTPPPAVKTKRSVNFQKPWRIFIFGAFLFCLTLLLGIAASFRVSKILNIQKITIPQISFWQFIFYFLFATSFFLCVIYLVKFKKGKRALFRTIFVVAVFFGGIIFAESWLKEPFPLIIILLLVFWWLRKPSVLNQDILIILGAAGVGSFLGLSLKPEIVIGFLVIFSIYDFIAVYQTKHMIKMAEEMIESQAILGLIIPSDIRDFQEKLEKIRPGGKFLVLGGGDIIFPLLLCSSLVSQGTLRILIITVFSLIGLFLSFWILLSQKTRRPIPALPPIALFSIIGYLIIKLI